MGNALQFRDVPVTVNERKIANALNVCLGLLATSVPGLHVTWQEPS